MAGTISRAAPSSASCRESRATLNRSSCARDPTNDPSMSNSVPQSRLITGMGLSNNALLIGALIDRESCRFVCSRIARIYDDNLFEQ